MKKTSEMAAHKFSHQQRGFTLTEMAIVLGIISLVTSAIWIASAQARQNAKINRAVTELYTMVGSIRSIYAMSGTMGQSNMYDMTPIMMDNGVFPSDMSLPGAYPQHPWGGITVNAQGNCPPFDGQTAFTRGACDATTFEVQFFNNIQNVPCGAFITRVAASRADNGLIAVYSSTDGWLDATTVKLSSISASCTYVAFAFKLR